MGQLLRENNQGRGYTYTWTYDNAGNIQSYTQYAYTTGELGDPISTVDYGYDDTSWGDLLTSYDGSAVTTDEIGNTLTYGNRTMTWEHGRQLATMTRNGATWTYTYNNAGLRTKRTNGTDTYEYVYNGTQLTQMTRNGESVYYTYDGSTPISMTYNGTTYYYLSNIQGDITGITDASGTLLVEYRYEAYGRSYITVYDEDIAQGTVCVNPTEKWHLKTRTTATRKTSA